MRLVFAVFVLSLPVVLMVPAVDPRDDENGVQSNEASLKSAVISVFQSLQHRLPFLIPVRNLALCGTCKFVTFMLQNYVKHNISQEIMVAFLSTTCKVFKVSTPEVCEGVIKNFKGEFFYVLYQSTLSPAQICGTLFPKTCESDKAVNWTVDIPLKNENLPKPYPATKKEASTLRVLHISDTHVDPLYREGSIANCKEPLCCQKGNASKSSPQAAGRWGAFQYCDIPMETLQAMLKDIRCTREEINLVYWTGDLVPHDYWNRSREKNLEIINRTTSLLAEGLPRVQVFPALGNHEGEPTDSFPQPEVTGNYSISWLYEEVAKEWSKWLPAEALDTFRKGGYYAVNVSSEFKVISMNMNYCNRLNWWLIINSTDPAQELYWLVAELLESEKNGQKVHILGHIPPGMKHCHRAWVRNYYLIITRFAATISGQFFGHTHKDEVQLFYDPENNTHALGVAYMGPSVTTYHSGDPAYRIYTVDGNYSGSSYTVLDHYTYTMNLTEANSNSSGEPQWSLEYSAKNAYNMTSLDPQDWDKLLGRMENDSALFEKFYGYYSQHNPLQPKCNDACRKKLLCEQKNSFTTEWWRC